MRPLISVAVPAFNHEKFIIQALDSIAAQTWERIEIILIDDCSEDNTYELASEWAGRNGSRFERTLFQKNKVNLGAPATINAAFEQAAGDWLTILNSDDCYSEDRFEKLLAAIEKSGREFAFSGVSLMDENGEEFLDEFALLLGSFEDRLGMYPELGIAILEKNFAVSSGNLFFSRRLYRKTGGFAQLKLAHDWDYLIRLLAWSEPEFVPEPLYRYRSYANNTWRRLKLEEFLDPQLILRRYFTILEAGNYSNSKYPLYQTWTNMKKMREVSHTLTCGAPRYHSISLGIRHNLNKALDNR